jgi:crotonobetainyl-CoA:carnitine CoA-transferase CaiB-like acyl-CoA transferase
LELLAAAGVPSSQVRDVAQVFEWPQTKALGSVQLLDHAEAGSYEVVSVPLRMDQAPLPYPSPAPTLGADTRPVLTALGMETGDIDMLVEAGAAIAP